MLAIDIDTAPRFILGKQDLWTRRRWRGEEDHLGEDEAFAQALAGGFVRFVNFLGASKLDVKAIGERLLRQCVGNRRTALNGAQGR